MKAKKENKVYDITELQKEAYLKEGYDIYDNNGKVIEYSPKKVVSYNEYIKAVNELKSKDNSAVEELTKANAKLTKQVEELTKANEKLTKELEKATSK